MISSDLAKKLADYDIDIYDLLGGYHNKFPGNNNFSHIIGNGFCGALCSKDESLVKEIADSIKLYVDLLHKFPAFREREFRDGWNNYPHGTPIKEYINQKYQELKEQE